MTEIKETACINCGCTESKPCNGGCYWLFYSVTYQIGLCSNCHKYESEYLLRLQKMIKVANGGE
jgi:hypothetical protein